MTEANEETVEAVYYGEPTRSTYTFGVPEGWYPVMDSISDLQERILQEVVDRDGNNRRA